MKTDDAARVGVVGGTGYTGQEVVGLLSRHPGASIEFVTSRSRAGDPSPARGVPYSAPDRDRARDVDVLFLCLPHGMAVEWVEDLRGSGGSAPRIIDLTADHRPGSGRESGTAYGLNEWNRDEVTGADVVANPGCYPTGMLLALLPLAKSELMVRDRLTVVNAASGVTGAGRSPNVDLLFAEVSGNYKAYGGGNRHRHLKEVRSWLGDLDILFQPHLLPIPRGILETIVVPVPEGVGAAEIRQAWQDRYREEPAVEVLSAGLPQLRQVVGSDRAILGVEDAERTGAPVVVVGAAIDNLGKGAAGQAVQNFNAMTGRPTEEGIRC